MTKYFYNKTTFEEYDRQHGPRMDFAIEKCGLDKLTGVVIEYGAGSCYVLKRMVNSKCKYAIDASYANDPSYNIDNQTSGDENGICRYPYEVDIPNPMKSNPKMKGLHDIGICFETIEHVASPYTLIENLKFDVKEGGDIFLSIPDVSVTHNTPYPGLFYPESNFVEFIEQMAVIPVAHYIWTGGWKTHIYHCKNMPWECAKMKFPKTDAKFIGKTPIEYANL